jgi:hypothetical protein
VQGFVLLIKDMDKSGKMVGRDGFEPSTNWLKANCSTTELTAPERGAYHTDLKTKNNIL